jgi:hypothetical protein
MYDAVSERQIGFAWMVKELFHPFHFGICGLKLG